MRHIFLLWLNPLGFFFGQIGSGFGQSLIVADFNNDNKDDIAVGAPMEGEDDMNKVDVGAVYIYYGTRDGVRVCMRACVVQHMLYTLNVSHWSVYSIDHVWQKTPFC